jgi:integrase
MNFTLTKAKINSTDSQFYYRFKIYYGKGKKSRYIPLNDLKLWNRPETTRQKDENKLNKQEVEERLDTLKWKLKSGDLSNNKSNIKFLDHLQFVKSNRGCTSESNLQIYNSVEKHLTNYMRSNKLSLDLLVSDVDFDFCFEFKTFLNTTFSHRSSYSKLSKSTQDSYFTRLCVIMNDAVSRGIIDKSPSKNIKAPEVPDKDITYLTIEEIDLLHKTECNNPMLKNVFLVAFYTGLRAGDIQKLRWKDLPKTGMDVELDLITGKKGKRLSFKIPKKALKLLPERYGMNDKVFMGFKYDNNQNKKLKYWALKAGITKEDITSHTARHSFAVYHLSKGTPIYTLSKLMAHNSVRTTERHYAQYAKEDLNKALNLVFD